MLVVLLAVAAVLALPAAVDLVRRADFRRMGLRNTLRRPTETSLIIIGSALGTAIIAAALLVGNTFDHSIRDIARRELGETDLILVLESRSDAEAAAAAITASASPDIDGVLALSSTWVSMAAGTGVEPGVADRAVEPRVRVAFTDIEATAAFGQAPHNYSLRAEVRPGLGEVLLTDSAAADLGVETGETVQVFLTDRSVDLHVVGIVASDGLAGGRDAWLDMDTLTGLDPRATLDELISNEVFVSGRGTVFDSVDPGYTFEDSATAAVDSAGIEYDSFSVKRDLIEDAKAEGAELSTTFSVIGGFSVLAGVLLLINLFVMLAEERKPSLGVLRALGWKRSALRRAFRVEGLLYAVPASIVGALLGIGVGWVIVKLTAGILSGANPNSDFQLIFSMRRSSLTVAALVGLIIALGSVWFTSWRISRLNIISAIRELPEPKSARRRPLVVGGAALAVALGVLMLLLGLDSNSPYMTVLAAPLIVGGIIIGVRVVLPAKAVLDRILVTIGSTIVLAWGALFFVIMPLKMTTDVDVEFFLLFGVVVVGAGVALATISGSAIQRLLARRESPAVESRMAMAYPTARPFRTASSLAMYSLIIFSLAFMAVISGGFASRTGDVIQSTSAGYDIMVRSNTVNPMTVDALLDVDGVAGAHTLERTGIQFWAPFDPATEADPRWQGVAAVSPEFASVGSPTLILRDERFATDEQALAAVASDPSLVLVSKWFLGDDDGLEPAIGDEIVGLSDDQGGAATDQRRFEIVGVTENDYTWSSVWMAKSALDELASGTPVERLYVKADDGVDPKSIADRIEAQFIERGADAETFESRVRRQIETDLGFFSLLRGYLLLGLVIGIGGLGVTLFRAVRERRRQIGMLRAMGLSSGSVRRWFLTEATFVSVMGIVTGISLGLLTGYFVVSRSNAIDGQLPFSVPWLTIIVVSLIPLVASGIAALIPARRAAGLLPSEALRLAD